VGTSVILFPSPQSGRHNQTILIVRPFTNYVAPTGLYAVKGILYPQLALWATDICARCTGYAQRPPARLSEARRKIHVTRTFSSMKGTSAFVLFIPFRGFCPNLV
jgi:hypothetical protein